MQRSCKSRQGSEFAASGSLGCTMSDANAEVEEGEPHHRKRGSKIAEGCVWWRELLCFSLFVRYDRRDDMYSTGALLYIITLPLLPPLLTAATANKHQKTWLPRWWDSKLLSLSTRYSRS